jgi:hypothetical protein
MSKRDAYGHAHCAPVSAMLRVRLLGIFRIHRIDNDPVVELELFVGKHFNYEVGSTASFETRLDTTVPLRG